MKGDFSRITFDPNQQFSGVRMQQGRVQLDSDWNEQMDILMHRFETEVGDFVGERAAASSAGSGSGFLLTANDQTLTLAPGRYYIRGKLFENAAPVTYESQPLGEPEALPSAAGTYVAYLDAWEQHVSVLEDPSLRELALGGADTTTRIRNVWQFRLEATTIADPVSLGTTWQSQRTQELSTVRMQAVLDPGAALENQLYRVELHSATLVKWARDNGSVAARIELNGKRIALQSGTLDTQRGFASGQTVELLTKEQLAAGLPGELIALEGVQGRDLVLASQPEANVPYVALRRWNGTFPFAASTKIPLENGIFVQFAEPAERPAFNSGDHWSIVSRAGQNRIEWPDGPGGQPAFSPPHGVRHFFVPLALLNRSSQWSVAADLRTQFHSLAEGFVSKSGDTMSGPLRITAQSASESALVIDRGNVGIGNSAPRDRLEIGNPLEATNQLLTITAAAGHVSGINLFSDGPLFGFRIENDGNLGGLGGLHVRAFDDGNEQPAMFIGRSGLVGVGTTSPIAQLHISGFAPSGLLVDRGNVGIGNTAPRDRVEIGNPSEAADQFVTITAASGHASGIKLFTGGPLFGFRIENDGNLSGLGGLHVRAFEDGNEQLAMFIGRSGLVGLGTVSPGAQLHASRSVAVGLLGGNFDEGQLSISGRAAELSIFRQGLTSSFPAAAGNRFALRNQANSLRLMTDVRGDLLTIPAAGDDRLQIGGFDDPSDCYLSLRAPAGGFRSGIRLHNSNEQTGFTIESDGREGSRGLNIIRRGPEVFQTAASAFFIDQASGRVGIGTTAPDNQTQLHVAGPVRASRLIVDSLQIGPDWTIDLQGASLTLRTRSINNRQHFVFFDLDGTIRQRQEEGGGSPKERVIQGPLI